MTLADLIKANAGKSITIGGEASLCQAAETLSRENVGVLVVTNGGGEMIGILSERDLVRALAAGSGVIGEQRVAEHMSERVIACEQTEEPETAIWLMAEFGIRHLPVTLQGRLVGMVSSSDILRLVSRRAQDRAI